MRTELELQHAHDTLHPVISGEAHVQMSPETRLAMTAALDALCWCLGHENNDGFGQLLADVRAALRQQGLRLVEQVLPE